MYENLVKYRRAVVTLWYTLLGGVSFVLAFVVRFEGRIPEEYQPMVWVGLPIAVLAKALAVHWYQIPKGLLRYANVEDVVYILKAATVSTIGIMMGVMAAYGHGFPRSIFVIDYLLTIVLFAVARFFFRFSGEFFQKPIKSTSGRRTLIIGAGDAGDMVLHAIKKDFEGVLNIVGFLDDDPMKWGMTIHGYPILGSLAEAPHLIQELEVKEVIIAITGASKDFIRSIVKRCSSRNVNFQILPTFHDYITGKVKTQKIRGLKVQDLLGREPIILDKTVVSRDINGKCVLVTGAGGSIGSELCRQIARFNPSKLVLLEAAETPLFEIMNELRRHAPDVEPISVIADIKHGDLVDKLFKEHRPDRIFHAAAYKHVPLMEAHPVEAVFNNVFGTRNLVEAAVMNGVEKFVMISTDKAVRPSSVMGATKRCAELLVASMNGKGTKFVTVRFGNVLGSTGSVVPIFQKQIAEGGPVRVTHPDMKRFFMTIPEAVELVLQAGSIGEGGEVFILDMGHQINITELARNMIELSGLEVGKDIEIEYTGLRPGEKLAEELVAFGEEVEETTIPKVMVHRSSVAADAVAKLREAFKPLEAAAMACSDSDTVAALWEIVTHHDPDTKGRDTANRW